MQQYKDNPFPKAFALQLGGVAGVEHALTLLEEMGVIQGPEHLPRVPAEAIVQRVRRYAPEIEQLVKIIVPVGKEICNRKS